MRKPFDLRSNEIATELSFDHFEEAMWREDTRLAKATNAYIEALQDRAMEIEESGEYPDLDVCDFMQNFHDKIGQLFYDL